MAEIPPAFENADRCRKCNIAFTLLNRKHHCRNCGGTHCGKCSRKEIAIPRYGFFEPVRVCDACYDLLSRPQPQPQSSTASADAAPVKALSTPASRAAAVAAARSTEPAEEKPAPAPVVEPPKPKVSKCTCGMPLCICPADPVPTEEKAKPQVKKEPAAAPRPVERKAPPPASTSSFSGFGGLSATKYDLSGNLDEQCREAIKAGDVSGVKMLLQAKANPKYTDRTGNTLVHLAALFNHSEICSLLIAAKGDIWTKNPAGETAVDLAPPALAVRMKAEVGASS